MNRSGPVHILVWDAAVRICHGGFALGMILALWLGYRCDPESPAFLVHMLAGFLALWFLAVRLVLACCGSRHARWRALIHGPRAVVAHLTTVIRWRPSTHAGLNPLTMLFAAALHVVLIGLVVTGFDGAWAAAWHGRLAIAALALIGCHLLGLILHALRHRDASALAMFHGRAHGPATDGIPGHGWRGGAIVFLASAMVLWLVWRGFMADAAQVQLPFLPVINLPFIQRG